VVEFLEKIWHAIPKIVRGILLMIAGMLLFLHTIGVIDKGITTILIIISIGIFVYGFVLAGLHRMLFKGIKEEKEELSIPNE
jgi:hypothetical protein